MLAEIDRAEAAAPIALPAEPTPFEKVAVSGHFRDDLSAWYGSEVRTTLSGPTLGAQLLTPLERAAGPPILVDRGWVPEQTKPPASPGEVTIVGYVRAPDPGGWATPAADPAARRFWALDPARIGPAIGLSLAPFTLVALGGDGIPQAAQALPRPPNDHLGYALTWFGLGACLVVVFAAYARRTLRR